MAIIFLMCFCFLIGNPTIFSSVQDILNSGVLLIAIIEMMVFPYTFYHGEGVWDILISIPDKKGYNQTRKL